MSGRRRQEVLNVVLAQVLAERGIVSAPESILKASGQVRIPDVIVYFWGLRTAIEGEVGDRPDARERALMSALSRVEEGITHIGVGVVYSPDLRDVKFGDLKSALESSSLDVNVVTEAGDTGFVTGDIGYLENALRRAFEHLVQEDVVARAVAAIDAGIERFAFETASKPGMIGRIARVLDIKSPTGGLTPEVKGAASRIGALIMLNAMIFHEVISSLGIGVPPIQDVVGSYTYQSDLYDQWAYILDHVDYFPIFHLAQKVLLSLSSDADVMKAVWGLVRTAQKIVNLRAALRHDLMGRVYHRLLMDAKYLGTFYTGIPAAALLLKLALDPKWWDGVDWSSPESVGGLRVADLACGTGTLLMATADAITDNYVEASANSGRQVDLGALQKILVEQVLYGYDVLPAAVHLTASTLAMRAPTTTFAGMNLFSLPLGGEYKRLGSLEFLRGRETQIPMDMFGALPVTQRVGGNEIEEVLSAPMPDLDLCVMNPPFTRSVGGNLLFGSLPNGERRRMQKELAALVRMQNVGASVTAGLGSVFVSVAHKYLKIGGRLALVLPKALLSGIAWSKTRELLNRHYRLDYLVVSHDPERWNFSESTNLSEVLLVATKTNGGENKGSTVVINFWRNPPSSFEALAAEYTLRHSEPPSVVDGQGAVELFVGDVKVGEIVSIPWEDLRERTHWMLPCAFAQSDLIRAVYHLLEGELWLPGYGVVAEIPLVELGRVATIGPDRRDVYDGFEPRDKPTAYPAFWGHNSDEVRTMAQEPNKYLSPLPKPRNSRPLRKVEDLWPLAGTTLVADRLWLKTQRVVALRVSRPVLSNVWWPISIHRSVDSFQEKAMVSWLNSTLGLLCLFSSREETRGAWVSFKKPTLKAMPILDAGSLDENIVEALTADFDRLAEAELMPFPMMADDPVRAEIDSSLARALGLPDFSILREMLAREPIVSLERL